MSSQPAKAVSVPVHFLGLAPAEEAPRVAVYSVDPTGAAKERIGAIEDGVLEVPPEWHRLGIVALGPDRELASIPRENLVPYQLSAILDHWKEHGLLLGPDIWGKFFFEFSCVHGTARKCRPWWWDRFPMMQPWQSIALKGVLGPVDIHPIFPFSCQPLCDGIVEVFERECCCRWPVWDDLLDRLREILEVLPIPNPPRPGPWPGPDPPPFRRELFAHPEHLAGVRALPRRSMVAVEPAVTGIGPSERLYEDYQALSSLSPVEAQSYLANHTYLLGILCRCTVRRIGETPLQPGGRISFCFLRPRRITPLALHCHRSYSVRIRQMINGQWVTVYDGPAGHNWFSEGEDIDVRTWNWQAKVCGSGSGTPPPGGALPFVMLEHVTGSSTHHFNFPTQDGVSHVSPLSANSGLFDTGYAADCPWGGSLGLRLWFSPELEPIAEYYRVSVVSVNDAGATVGTPTTLDAPVSWQRFEFVGGTWVAVPELLSVSPAAVGGQIGLAKIPYWGGGRYWLSGQYHQLWNTALFTHGKYLLVVEVFDAAGVRIKPNGATGPGTAAAFEFRRWTDPITTASVPFADLAHALWIDNSPVVGDIVDIRRNGVESTAECQFISGPATTTVSLGFRAYHLRGVSDPTNTFLLNYALTWHRGLNGPSGTFETGAADVGEPPAAAHPSNALTLGSLLGAAPAQQRCTFAAHLAVTAKHWTGGARIQAYDYHEIASFALSLE